MNTTMEELENRVQELENRLDDVTNNMPEDKLSMVVFSGDLDHMLGAFIIATAAAAMYEKVVMFFTFWATPALIDKNKRVEKTEFMAKMFAKMLPRGADQLKLSQMNMAGMGTRMMKTLMKQKNIMSLTDLMRTAAEFGVEIVICEMSMDLMGISREEIIDFPNITIAGAATFLEQAGSSKVTLFI